MGGTENPLTSGVRTPDEKWFPRAVLPAGEPRLWVFCFPGAGMEASVYTGVGTSLSPMPNPLCEFAQKEGIGVLGVQLPFRGLRRKEEHPKTIQQSAKLALQAMRPLIEKKGGTPYMLVGYSMGAWIAYEVLCLLQQYHLAPPVHFVAVAMVSPDLPIHLRPWKRTASLDTQGFQDQLRAWNCNEILFQKDMWAVYEPLLRADHNMLDEYKYTDLQKPLSELAAFRGCCGVRTPQQLQAADGMYVHRSNTSGVSTYSVKPLLGVRRTQSSSRQNGNAIRVYVQLSSRPLLGCTYSTRAGRQQNGVCLFACRCSHFCFSWGQR